MILVDSDALIWHLRGSRRAHRWLRQAREKGPVLLSAVSLAEITGGMRSSERDRTWGLLAALRVEPVTEVIARRAGEYCRRYRKSHGAIDTTDYLIAATADVLGAELATLNVKHFPMFPELRPPFDPEGPAV